MSLAQNSSDRWNSAFDRVAVTIETAVRERSIINARRQAQTILEECQIPVDDVAMKAIIDRILVLAMKRDVLVHLGD